MPLLKRQVVKTVIQVVLGLIGLLAISAILLLWQLSVRPVQLSALTPSIQRALSSLPGDHAIQVGGIELVWDRPLNAAQLRATGVALLDPGGGRIVVAPAVNVSISLKALINGVIALSAVELKGVRIHLVRGEDGSLLLGAKTPKAAGASNDSEDPDKFHDLTEVLTNVFTALESPPDSRQPLSYLNTIDLQGELTAEDRKLDREFLFEDILFSFRGQENGITGDLTLSAASPQALSGIDLKVSLLAQGADVSAELKVSDVQLSRLAGLSEELELLKGVDLTLDATVTGVITLPDQIKSLELDMVAGKGSIALDGFFADPIAVRALKLKVQADLSARNIKLTQLNLALGEESSTGPSVRVSGDARRKNGDIKLDLRAKIEHFQVGDLAIYWPVGVVPGVGDWLTENLKVGAVDKASVSTVMTLPSGKWESPVLKKLQGTLAYSDLSVFYYRPLPPATGVSGSGTFNQQGFDLDLAGGLVEDISIQSGKVRISGLDVAQTALNVVASLDGQVADVLAVLALPPIELDKITGVGAAQAGGQVTAKFTIALPLKTGLEVREIDYRVDASLDGVSVDKIMGGFNLENGVLDIHNDPGKLAIKGSLDLAGIPIVLDLHGTRHSGSGWQTKITAKATQIKAGDISRLGYPAEEYLSGSLDAQLEAMASPDGVVNMAINADLGSSSLSIPELNWNKPAGEAASASASVTMSSEKELGIKDIRVEAGTLSARGEATFNAVDSTLTINLESAALGKTTLDNIAVSYESERGTGIKVSGGQLDLEPFMAAERRPAASTDSDRKVSSASPGSISVDVARLDKVFFSDDRYLEEVSLNLVNEEGAWQSIRLNGRNAYTQQQHGLGERKREAGEMDPGEFSLSFGPLMQGQYPLTIEVENLGALLVTTLDNDHMRGGYLTVSGGSSNALFEGLLKASLKLDNFIVQDLPLATQVLNLASLDQPLNLLEGDGLVFDVLYGELTLSGKKLSIDKSRAHGGSLGTTIIGNIDYGQRTLNLQGSVIPLYRLSNVLGKIPLLNKILLGDDGKGIVELDYKVSGSMEKPQVEVHPGSVLTQGALRDVVDHIESPQ